MYFHDCTLRHIEFVAPNTAVIHLDGFKHFWGSNRLVHGIHRLIFKGVIQTDLALRHLNCEWMYEEIDRMGEISELRVLLIRGNQFHIRFRAVSIHSEPAGDQLA